MSAVFTAERLADGRYLVSVPSGALVIAHNKAKAQRLEAQWQAIRPDLTTTWIGDSE